MRLKIPGQGISFNLIRPLVGFKSKLDAQLSRFPYENNVFLMMRFRRGNEHLSDFMIETLAEAGLVGIRADAQDWNLTNDVYNPLAVLYCCKYGIALFDEPLPNQAYNPNVIYELAIMHYQQKDCLILRHARLPDLPFDLIKNLYFPYDRDLAIRENIRTWINQVRPTAASSPVSELPDAVVPEERGEVRVHGSSLTAADFRWEVRGRGKSREVSWKLKLANIDMVPTKPKLKLILMAEDGFLLSDHTAQFKVLKPSEAETLRSTLKIASELARRLKRIMVICEGKPV